MKRISSITIAEREAHERLTRPDPFVAGQDCFIPDARQCIWDLRRGHEGIIEPLDLSAPIHIRPDNLVPAYKPIGPGEVLART